MSFFGKNQALLTPLLGFIGSNRENHVGSVYLALSQLWLTTLSEKFMSANCYGIIAVTGRAHWQRQVAFFDICGHLVKKVSHRFLKDGLATKISGETWKGVCLFMQKAASALVVYNLN